MCGIVFFFFKQKTAYEMRISDWSSDVSSSDLWWPRPKPSSASPPKQARVVLLFAKGSGACRSPFLFLERHKGSVSRAMSDELEQLVQSAQADIAACADEIGRAASWERVGKSE